MSVEKVRNYFKKWNRENDILEMENSTATVELAAQALGTEPKRIAKTLSFATMDGKALVIVVAGDAKIDNAKYKTEFGYKAKMLTPVDALKFTDYEVGGICPFDVPKETIVYLDESLKRFDTIFPACGSSNSAIELTINELEQYSCYSKWIDVCKNWN